MSYLELFASGFLLSLSLCLDIGVVNIALINTAIAVGVRRALVFGLGSCLGDLIYAALSLAGIGWLLRFSAVRWSVHVVGALLLSGLFVFALRSAWRPTASVEHGESTPRDSRRLFLYGLGVTLASPTAILWFAAVGGSLIAAVDAHTPAMLAAFLGGFFCAGFSWCLFIASVAALGGRRLGERFRRGCHLVSALLFLYFAVIVIRSAVTTL